MTAIRPNGLSPSFKTCLGFCMVEHQKSLVELSVPFGSAEVKKETNWSKNKSNATARWPV